VVALRPLESRIWSTKPFTECVEVRRVVRGTRESLCVGLPRGFPPRGFKKATNRNG